MPNRKLTLPEGYVEVRRERLTDGSVRITYRKEDRRSLWPPKELKITIDVSICEEAGKGHRADNDEGMP